MGPHGYGVAVLTAATVLWAMSGTQKERPLLAAIEPEGIHALELCAASHPLSVEPTRALAQAYLDATQPGLAIVLVEGAAAPVRDDVRVQHVYARALVDEGRDQEALAVEGGVVSRCHPVAEDAPAPAGCDGVLLATASTRSDILRELVLLGVEDAQAHPEMSLVAYENATRETRIALQ